MFWIELTNRGRVDGFRTVPLVCMSALWRRCIGWWLVQVHVCRVTAQRVILNKATRSVQVQVRPGRYLIMQQKQRNNLVPKAQALVKHLVGGIWSDQKNDTGYISSDQQNGFSHDQDPTFIRVFTFLVFAC